MSGNHSEDLQRQAEHVHSRRPPILGYLVILFAAAFLLLLLAYFQQQRANTETTDALKQSVSAVQSIQQVIEENQALHQETDSLKDQISQLKEQMVKLESQLADTREDRQALEAMDYFWQINEAYVRSRNSLCRQLIEEMEEKGLSSSLPDWKATDNERFSPVRRYQEIYDAIF